MLLQQRRIAGCGKNKSLEDQCDSLLNFRAAWKWPSCLLGRKGVTLLTHDFEDASWSLTSEHASFPFAERIQKCHGLCKDVGRVNALKITECCNTTAMGRALRTDTRKSFGERLVPSKERGRITTGALHTCWIQNFLKFKQDWVPVISVNSDSLPFVRVYFDDVKLFLVWNKLSQLFSTKVTKSCCNISS